MKFLTRFIKEPLVHFLFIGFILVWLNGSLESHSEYSDVGTQRELVISQNQIEQLKRDISLQTGTRPTEGQLERMLQATIDDELLYREAIALQLDKNNPSIRQRLIDLMRIAEDSTDASDEVLYKKALALGMDRYDPVIRRLLIGSMRLVAQKLPTRNAPSKVDPEDLAAYYNTNKSSFTIPMRIKLTHLYFSRDKRGRSAELDAERLLKEISSSESIHKTLANHGDAFLGGKSFSWMTPTSLERLFGVGFARQLNDPTSGRWIGPISSSYGWHLVFVDDLRPSKIASLSEVGNQIKTIILQQREQQRLAETLTRLRASYEIVIEDGDTGNA